MRLAVSLLSLSLLSLTACSKSGSGTGGGTGGGSGSAAIGSASGSAAGSSAGSAAGSAAASGSSAVASGSDAIASGSGGSGSGSGSDDAPTGPFSKLDHDGKVAVMKKRVMPAMRAAFAKFDPDEFGKITCKTCHGKDPDAVKFKMPTPDLPALDFKALEAGKDKKITEFMAKVVKPEMAKILGEPEMTPDHADGFGCLDCHTEKKKN